MKKNMDDMQISINEKEAEIIRLNMCLGDEKKKNQMTGSNNTPKRISQSSSRVSMHYQDNGSLVRNIMDSPYFQNQMNPTQTRTMETQTEPKHQDMQAKLKRYEDMLQSESQANEELTERIQSLEQSLY